MTTYEAFNAPLLGKEEMETVVFEEDIQNYKKSIRGWFCPYCNMRVDDIHDAHLVEDFLGDIDIYHRDCYFEMKEEEKGEEDAC